MGSLGLPELLMVFVTLAGGTAFILAIVYLIARRHGPTDNAAPIFCTKCGAKNGGWQSYCGRCGQLSPAARGYGVQPASTAEFNPHPAPNDLLTNALAAPPSIVERTTDLLEPEVRKPSLLNLED